MKDNIDNHIVWNEAAKSGLVLGLFTGLFILLGALTSRLATVGTAASFLAVALNAGLWLVKFLGCLWLLRFFMLKIADKYSGVTIKTLSRFGMLTALTSAIIVSGLNLLNTLTISSADLQMAVDAAMKSYPVALGESERVAIERMTGRLPQITFFVSLIYCFIYGTVASKILAGTVLPKDEFGDPIDEQ